MDLLVNADAFPDGKRHWSARVTSAEWGVFAPMTDRLDEAIGSMTCVPKRDRWHLYDHVADLVSCAADLEPTVDIYVRLHWRDSDPQMEDLA